MAEPEKPAGTTLAKLADALTKVKTVVQLTGFIVVAVVYMMVFLSKSQDVIVLIVGAVIAISLLFFGVILNQLRDIPLRQRAWLVIAVYAMFAVLILIFLVVASDHIQQLITIDQEAAATHYADQVAKEMEFLNASIAESKITEDILNNRLQELRESGLSGTNLVEVELKQLRLNIEEKERSLNVLSDLHEDLTSPQSNFAEAVAQAKTFLAGVRYSESTFDDARRNALAGDLNQLREILQSQFQELSKIQFLIGWLNSAEGDSVAAREQYEEILERDPNDTKALEELAELEFESRQYDKSGQYYDKLVEIHRRSNQKGPLAFALANRATVARYQDDYASAQDYIQEAELILSNPIDQRDFYFAISANDIGFYYMRIGRLRDAGRIFQKSYKYYDNPQANLYSRTDILHNYSVYLAEMGQLAEAEKLARKAIQLTIDSGRERSYDHAIELYNLGSILLLAGHHLEESREILLQAKKYIDAPTPTGEGNETAQPKLDLISRIDFEIALNELYRTSHNVHLETMRQILDSRCNPMIGGGSFACVDLRRRFCQALCSVGQFDAALASARALVEHGNLKSIPPFSRDIFEVELLFAEAIACGQESEALLNQITGLKSKFQALGEDLNWIDFKLEVALLATQRGSLERATLQDRWQTALNAFSPQDIVSKKLISTLQDCLFSESGC